ncbi:Acetyl-coenzyme A synthetase [Phycisphaerae bacterium RAS1]|nr:Acetyl-coenzyme A synthetase [Phycisphaerae bacterium RAS1]
MSDRQLLWQPSPQRLRSSHLHTFLHHIAKRHGIPADWESLRSWSIAHRDRFWEEMLRFADIQHTGEYRSVVSGEGMLGTKWFDGIRLNYARHMLRFDGPQPAILFENERGDSRTISQHELRELVARAADALRRDGVRRGDRVAAFMPNVPETVILMLAAASLGAIWSSCSPDFGVRGVLDRFGQIEPVVLLVTDGYFYGGKRIDCIARVADMLCELPSIRRVVVVPYVSSSVGAPGPTPTGADASACDEQPAGAASHRRPQRADATGAAAALASASRQVTYWSDYLSAALDSAALEFEELPFDHPLFIMYSSGTTGVPKCIVHGHGGTLIQHMKELMLHSDLHAGDRLFYFTTCGWMMWNWLASGLGVGAAIVLFDGNPAHPTVHRLWEMAAKLKITHFGTSPKFLGVCQKAHLEPGREHDLFALRALLSTGSPLSDELFRWVYAAIKQDVQLSSISGGTDIISCFMLGNPLLPVYAGEIQCRGLAMDVKAWDENGKPVIGRKGELVCCSPFPSQPVAFWNDPDGSKYRKAYFDHYPGVWRHGDFIEITETGGIIVYGRSDATLNPGGVRIGTAEIYRVVEGLPEVVDSIVVGRKTADQDEEVCLFVVLRPGMKLDTALSRKIADAIAAGASKRHVPKHIRQVSAIPHTISGKKVEMAVMQILHGQEVKNKDALANPEALAEFAGLF